VTVGDPIPTEGMTMQDREALRVKAEEAMLAMLRWRKIKPGGPNEEQVGRRAVATAAFTLQSGHGAQGPPQSQSVSSPFWMPSSHVGGSQRPAQQTLLKQSEPTLQPSPVGQRGQLGGPPQSTPVSLLFETPSKQVGGWHADPIHTPLRQSLLTLQG
jgi:hypothetical protein